MTGPMTTVAEGFRFLEAPRWRDGRLWFSDFYSYQVRSMREDGSDLREEADRSRAALRSGLAARRPAAGRLHARPQDPAPGAGRHARRSTPT